MAPTNRIEKYLREQRAGESPTAGQGSAAVSYDSEPLPELFSVSTIRSLHGWEFKVGLYLPASSEGEFLPRLVALHGWGQTSVSDPWWSYLDFLDMSQLIPACRDYRVELVLPQAPWRNWTRLRSERSIQTLAASVNDLSLESDGNQHYPGSWIAGFSNGADMAQHAFTQSPDRWKGMMLAGARPVYNLDRLAADITGKTIIIQRPFGDRFSTHDDVMAIVDAFIGRNRVFVIDHKSLTPYRVPFFKGHRWDSSLNDRMFRSAFASSYPQEESL